MWLLFKKKLSLLLLLCFIEVTFGSVYVALNGTDIIGCGMSLSQPCRTLHFALVNQSQPIDIITLLPGDYNELTTTLTDERNITIKVRFQIYNPLLIKY